MGVWWLVDGGWKPGQQMNESKQVHVFIKKRAASPAALFFIYTIWY